MKRSEIFFATLLVPLDALALFLAFIFAYHLRDSVVFNSPASIGSFANEFQYNPLTPVALPFEQYLGYLAVIIPAMIIIFAAVGLYTIRSNANWTRRFVSVLIGVSGGEVFILFLFLLKKDFFMPRSTVLYSWVLAILFVLIGRFIIRTIQTFLHRYGKGIIRLGIIGKSDAARDVARHLSKKVSSAYQLVAQLPTAPPEDLVLQLEPFRIDELIVVNERYSNDDLIALRNYCLENHISFSFVPSLLTELQSIFDVRQIAGMPMIEVRPTPLEGWGRVVKRIFDIVVSFLLIILFSPIFLLVALSLKIASPGPLIYKHKRIGKNKKAIYVWKFRSMKREFCTGLGYDGNEAFDKLLKNNPDYAKEWEETHKLKNDPRISLPGKFIRATSLDELPQFFNVLGGTLSLVGPRPIVDDEVRKYGEAAKILFSVRPGVTGLWQVSGRNDVTYDERIELDTYYIEHWGLWSDIVIMIKTVWVLIKKGAY